MWNEFVYTWVFYHNSNLFTWRVLHSIWKHGKQCCEKTTTPTAFGIIFFIECTEIFILLSSTSNKTPLHAPWNQTPTKKAPTRKEPITNSLNQQRENVFVSERWNFECRVSRNHEDLISSVTSEGKRTLLVKKTPQCHRCSVWWLLQVSARPTHHAKTREAEGRESCALRWLYENKFYFPLCVCEFCAEPSAARSSFQHFKFHTKESLI